MRSGVVRALKMVSNGIDRVAQAGQHRFIRETKAGIAHGEHVLKQLFALLDVDTVFDVGANVGQYAQQLRGDVGYRGAIVSFEPLPHAAQRVRQLAQSDASWRVVECAIDDRAGKTTFNIMSGDEFSSLLPPSKDFEGRFHGQHHIESSITVDVITLADAVAMAPDMRRGLLKLDTQGTELRLLAGGLESLQRFPAVQMEVAFKALYEGEETFETVVRRLDAWGYELCALFPNNHGHFPHLVEMDSIFLRRDCMPALP